MKPVRHLVLLWCLACPAAAQERLDAAILGCEGVEVPADEFRIVYGPFWDGAWRFTVTKGGDGEPSQMRVESFDYQPADHSVALTGISTRGAGTANVRRLLQASLTMINEIELKEDAPELYSQRRPLTIQVGMSDNSTRCASGYANWPRLPGSYYFEAVDLLHDSVTEPGKAGDVWPAVHLLLDQVKPARLRR